MSELLVAGAAARALLGAVWRRRRLRVALLLLAVLGLLGCGGWLWLRQSSLAAVRQVRISGVRGADSRAIEAALSTAARRMSTLDVSPAALRAAVAPFREVREVRASATFPHGLRIRVVEQLPVAALVSGSTRTAVAVDGVVLGPALLSGSLPTVGASSLPATGARVGGGWAAEELAVLGAAPRPLAKLTIKAFVGREGLTLMLRGGVRAYFGDASRPRAKWAALALALASEPAAGASYVDVRVPERPAAGFRAGTAPASASGSGTGGAPATVHSLSEATVAALSAGLPTEGSGKAPAGSAAAEEEAGIKPRSSEGTRGPGSSEASTEGSSSREGAAASREGTSSAREGPSASGQGGGSREGTAESGASGRSEGH